MNREEIKVIIDKLISPENEKALLFRIGKEVENTKEFQRLVKARKEYPELTIGETSISIWIHGIPEENYAEPFEFSDKEENLFTELLAPVSVEYAGFADYASSECCAACEGDAKLTVARDYYGLSSEEPHPIKLSDHPELEELFARLEEIEGKKIKECIKIWSASKSNSHKRIMQ